MPTTIQPTMDKFRIMSDYHRLFVKGGTYFFTVVTYDRQPLLCEEPALSRLKKAFRYVRDKHPYRMDWLFYRIISIVFGDFQKMMVTFRFDGI